MVAAVSEEAPRAFGAHGCQCSTYRLDQSLFAAGADLPRDALDLQEDFLYQILWSEE
jgi:hypothetical protein